MFRSEIMRKTTIFGLNEDRNKILAKLHMLGVAQPTDIKVDKLERINVSELASISENLLNISRMANVMKLATTKLPFLQNIFGLETLKTFKITRLKDQEILKQSEDFRSKYEVRLISLEQDYNQAEDRKVEFKELNEIISLYSRLNIPLSKLCNTAHTAVLTGKISNNNIAQIRDELANDTDGYFEFMDTNIDDKESVFVIICLNQNINNVNFLIRKYNALIYIMPDLPESDISTWIAEKIQKNDIARDEIVSKIHQVKIKIYDESLILRESLEILKNRYEMAHSIIGTQNYFVLQAWVMKKDIKLVEKELDNDTKGRIAIDIEEPHENDNVPVRLSNHKFLKPFEMLVELYSLPKYRDLDPTFIVGPLFVIFAAFMLTDAIYGSFLLLFGLFMYFKLSKYNSSLKDISIIISLMGSLTILFGILTGSYFGDLTKYLFGLESKDLAIWRDPLTDPLYFLIVSLVVAVVYLNIGFILGCIEDHRKSDYWGMFKGRIVWFLLQLAIAGLYLGILPLSKYLLIATIVAIVFTKGPLGLLDITGLMGDMISFSRLFALGLSTSGIALAVNLLANLVITIPVVGIIFAILIFIGGHGFGFVMNSIGGFVHSLRLQFVEFFGRFYEGGGDPFVPVKEERIYTEVDDGG